ncbi:C-3 sterol dehydrogenase [Auriscalpium vulgare]|uniref:C-3 sterol dehydrogenase n=1 Tax=Auriscalpium vulgare TaxID=40419 RepID=A0ACB8S241_9AGAM|nr:C-3 sterol dehydrogenase [Auriscalpium vulgare]
MSGSRESYIVIGGSGFLGRHIVEALLARGDVVSVFDIMQRYDDVPFYMGDISDETQVSEALQKSGATCIIHTASPPHGIEDPALYWKVNVDGTKAVIAAAVANGVKKLVYTSSAGVVFNGEDLIDVDERLPFPTKPLDAYNESKATAEDVVLAANDVDGLLTVALRPAGIFGPGDRQAVEGIAKVLKEGKAHFQIGDNTNLFDWTYVGNVAYAHLLAADKLVPPTEKSDAEIDELLEPALPAIDLTVGHHRVPTSAARPLGPYVTRPPNADALEAAFAAPASQGRTVVRSRFDQLSVPARALAPDDADPLQVAGQAFFITNGEPVYFWDFMRGLWRMLEPETYPARKTVVLPRTVGFLLATASEWWGWLTGHEPTFTRFRVTFTCAQRYHNIEKARRVLGYEPQIGLEEGMRRTVEVSIECLSPCCGC